MQQSTSDSRAPTATVVGQVLLFSSKLSQPLLCTSRSFESRPSLSDGLTYLLSAMQLCEWCASVVCAWELVHSRYVAATALDSHISPSNSLSLIHGVDGRHMVDA